MTHKKNDTVTILIVEDSPVQAEQLAHLLGQHGYATTVTANGREALAALGRSLPTLVISDVVMPELDGYGLCCAIKSDDRLKHLPVMLVTALSDPQDIVRGLECGADNFICKPYDERYLLACIGYILENMELRGKQQTPSGVEIRLGEHKYFITAERQQILDLLISIYEQAIRLNHDLKARDLELEQSYEVLQGLYRIAEGLNRASGEREVAEITLERALELPGIRAGWIFLREGESGFRLAASRNLPPSLSACGALEGDCRCKRMLDSGELAHVTSIIECERMHEAADGANALRHHASVPLWIGGRTVGVMNLAGTDEALYGAVEQSVLYGVGNQVAVALERALLQENLERLVRERTAKLEAEIRERKRIEKEQARLVAIIEATPDMVATGNPDGHATYCNPAGLRMLGFERLEELAAAHYLNVHPEWAKKLVRETGIPHAIAHGSWSGETSLLREGRELPVSQVILAHKGEDGQIEYLTAIMRDISALKENEKRIMRLNRVYAVLSSINTTIVRTRSRQELFDEACRIAVEQGQFRFAWVGLFDAAGANLTPVAKAGFEDGFLGKIVLSARDDTVGCFKLLVQTLREGRLVVSNDIESDPRTRCWREEAARRDYHSMAAFPLRCGAEVVGVLSLYAQEKGFFDPGEMKLLTEIDDDISFGLDHIEKEERLNYLAYYDDLTGLPNRALFYDRMNQLLLAADKKNTLVALLLVNLERMREINEALGRPGGDALLKLVAQRLGGSGMNANHLAHIGAGYFAVALDDIQREADAAHVLEHDIAACLAQPFAVGNNKELRVSAKAGIALFPSDGADADTLFRNADAALKKAKLAGDKYLFYTPELNARVAENLMLENKLRRALERGQLVLHYQPKVDLMTGKISGLEALMRWNDPDTGLVPPVQFIPLLEESGLILEAGQWALEQAAADFRRWQDGGLRPPRIAVNVSVIQLRHKDFVGMVERVLGDAGGLAASLEIEITESMVMHDIEANIRKLQAIRDMGLEIAVDDFGTGYSSLNYLTRLPVNTLKIDRSFIANITGRATDADIVSAIVSLGRSLGLKIIAEGVETEEQKTLLQRLGCDEMQGYLFSRPLPAADMEAMLRREK